MDANGRHGQTCYSCLRTHAKHATLVSGHPWQELREMLDNQAHEPEPQMYSVKAVAVPETPMVMISLVARTKYIEPWKIRAKVIEWFEHLHPSANPNRGRLSGSAQSLTFGAQTGRGSDRSCVINRTNDYQRKMRLALCYRTWVSRF